MQDVIAMRGYCNLKDTFTELMDRILYGVIVANWKIFLMVQRATSCVFRGQFHQAAFALNILKDVDQIILILKSY